VPFKELKLMQIDGENLGIPEQEYACNITMPAEEFQRIVRDLQVLGDACGIQCTKEGVRFSVTGQIGTGNILVRSRSDHDKPKNNVEINMSEPVELQFALRYLTFFTKATPLSDIVIIRLSPDIPILIEYPIGEHGYIRYYLAPKIEDDGDA
jgi:proliferating cell nuclear antigen